MVVGAGRMGSGIAQVAAEAGVAVLLCDTEQAFLDRGLAAIGRFLKGSVERGETTPEAMAETLARIEATLRLEQASGCDFVIEAVTEDLPVKQRVFRALDASAPPGAVLASNTSSLPITQLAAFTSRPQNVIGMHFMNPVPLMKLVEVIRGLATDQRTVTRTMAFAAALGKTPVQVRDSPGFVVNRLLMPLINEAAFCVYEGIATAEDVDQVMRLGANHPMGPLALGDLVGLDVVLSILDVLHAEFKDPKYRACPLLRQMVRAGRLGRKSGRGFYDYSRA
jgi:3-hydroxybutyryl-CoA dehydrogenase